MNIDISEVRNKRFIHISHLVIYLFMIGYGVMSIFQYRLENLPINISVITSFLFFFLVELFTQKKGVDRLAGSRFDIPYYFIRLLSDVILYFISPDKIYGLVFLILMIIFCVEVIFYMAYDETEKRVLSYVIFAAGYSLVSIVLIITKIYADPKGTPGYLCELAAVVSVTFAVILIGEIMAGIWDAFVRHLLAQNRALEGLNQANDALKQHQDQISKINETLGVQKIELQTANKKINRAHDEMSVQNEISSAIVATSQKEELLKQVTKILQVRLDLDLVMVILEEDNSLLVPGEDSKGRYVALSSGLGTDFEENIRESIRRTDLNELLSMSKTYIQNTATDSIKFFKYLSAEQELSSMICLPLIHQDSRIGTILIGKKKENAFVDGRAFYENIAGQISIGISNAKLYEKMNDMAIRDGLTRIFNRRHLSELLNEYLGEAVKRKAPVSLALFDIDKFKMVNDTYGHQCGDAVIRYVATLLNRGAIRNGGIAGRYGGEEFVVVFMNKSLQETYEIVKDIHSAIKSEPVVYEDKEVLVRASVGVASFPETCSNPGELLNRADWAMYHSKKNGRDQITIDSDQIKGEM